MVAPEETADTPKIVVFRDWLVATVAGKAGARLMEETLPS